jgi:hypothetical protein
LQSRWDVELAAVDDNDDEEEIGKSGRRDMPLLPVMW